MLYAAYGSNLHPLRLGQRTASARLLATGCLPDWSLHFHKRSVDGSGKCSIAAGSSGIHVAVFDINAADKKKLDAIEGLGAGYAGITLHVPGVGDCMTYIAEDAFIDDALAPYDWYKALVLAGARTHGFPPDYIESINAVVACSDPDPERSARGWQTVDRVTA